MVLLFHYREAVVRDSVVQPEYIKSAEAKYTNGHSNHSDSLQTKVSVDVQNVPQPNANLWFE